MELNIAEIVFLIPLSCFLFVLYIYIPWMILHPAVSTLIGRPLGSGWKRVEGEICTDEPADAAKARVLPNASILRMARFELDGQEYKVPLCSADFSPDEGQCTLYVKRKNPQTVWVSKYQNRLTAFIGSVMILALWAGLVYAGIFIARAIKG